MYDFWGIVVVILGSGAFTAVITAIMEAIKHKRDRREADQDKHSCDLTAITTRLDKMWSRLDGIENRLTKAEDKFDIFDDKVSAIRENLDINTAGTKATLRAQLRMLGEQYIKDGEITSDDLDEWIKLHTIYHNELCGNGFLDSIRKKIDNLPIKK